MNARTRQWVTIGLITLAAAAVSWQIVRPFLDVLLWAVVLTIVTYPLYLRFRARGNSPDLAALMTVGATIACVVIPMTLLTGLLIVEASRIAQSADRIAGGAERVFSTVYNWVDANVTDLDKYFPREEPAEGTKATNQPSTANESSNAGSDEAEPPGGVPDDLDRQADSNPQESGGSDQPDGGSKSSNHDESSVKAVDGSPPNLKQLTGFVGKQMQSVAGEIVSRSTGVIGGLIGFVLQTMFVLFAMFYLLRDGDRALPQIKQLLPLSQQDTDEIFDRTRDIIYASMVGVVVIAAIQGVLGGLAFWVAGLPSPVLWGAVMFLLSMIPAIGAGLVWGPAAIYLAATGKWGAAIGLALWGFLVISMIDNLLRPKIVGKRVKLNELVIFFAVLGGLQVFGVIGLVIGPVAIAVTLMLVEIFRRISGKSEEPPAEHADNQPDPRPAD